MYSFRKKIKQSLIRSFVKINKFKIKDYYLGKNILLVDRNLPESNLITSYFSYILNKKYNYDIYLLTSQSKNNQLNEIYNSFQINNIFNINIKKNFFDVLILFKSFLFFIYSFF